MRIATNAVSESIVRQIQKLGTQQSKLQQQVATGQKIIQAEDDPAAMGRVLNIESEQRQVAQFGRNANRALELSQVSFSGLQQIKKVSDRATEIGTLGSGTINAASAKAYASEVDQLIEQTAQLANSKFRQDFLFAGTAVDRAPFALTRDFAGKVTGVEYEGNAERTAIALSPNSSLAPGASPQTNLGLRDFIRQLVQLRDALTQNDGTSVSTTQSDLVASEDLLVSALADQGGIQTRIEASQTQQNTRADNLEALLSGEADADLPSAIVKLNQAQTAYQAALQSAANIMKISLLDYIR